MKIKRIMQSLLTICANLLLVCMLSEIAHTQVVVIKRTAMSPPQRKIKTTGTNQIYSGLRTVGKGMQVCLRADTAGSGTNVVSSFAWTFASKPIGSMASFTYSTQQDTVWFIADSGGQYVVQVMANSVVSFKDTLFASTYAGATAGLPGCSAGCHASIFSGWQSTGHANWFKNGITGNLENNADPAGLNRGTYGPNCIKCHTTGWEPNVNNGNFGFLAHQGSPAWDTTWYNGLPGNYFLTKDTLGIWNQLSSSQQAVANIGCESCHGPGGDHNSEGHYGDITKISKSLDAGVCNQCHDSPTHHNIGTNFNASAHATLSVSSAEASNKGCWPCHNGSAFAVDSWRHNWSAKPSHADTLAGDPNFKSISCASCHDPHSTTNPNQLRYVSVDSLYNGYKITKGGKGQLCMNCHRARSSVTKSVTTKAPKYGWAGRFGGHHSVQADLLFGQNGYTYGTVTSTPSIHLNVTINACVSCHMQDRNGQPNHEFTMDSAGVKDFVGICNQCHSEVTSSFDQKTASQDYDGNGITESFITEVNGLLAILKAKLPQDSFGNVISSASDSMKIYNRPDLVQGIWNYNFITEDRSNGIHNPAYTVALLRASIASITTSVEKSDAGVPGTFTLNQNYPNPFNPTTKISFSLPLRAIVRLEIFDILGKQVATLLNESMEAGNWNINWNGFDRTGRHVSSGVYFYRLEAGNFSSVKKMVLLK
jgi:hypothetical protein